MTGGGVRAVVRRLRGRASIELKSPGEIEAMRAAGAVVARTLRLLECHARAGVSTGELDELALAYALTIHKAQGSEYPAVVIPLHTQHYMMLQRNLLYTGITRGKKLVVLVGNRKALSIAVQRQDTVRRYSALGRRLQEDHLD